MTRLLLALGLLAATTSWGQQAAQGDTVRIVRVAQIEHGKAGPYARKGALLCGVGATIATGIIMALTPGPSYTERMISGQPQKDRHAGRNILLAGGIGLGAGAILGAIIGSGERWTEERQLPARVGLVPLRDGALLAVSLSWP